MALNYVSLLFTEQDAGNDPQTGSVVIAPTSVVTAAGVTVVDQIPVVRQFSGGTVTVSLVACDNTGTVPVAGFWAYNIQLPGGVSGLYLVNFSNGASQRFDNLTPVVAQTTYGPAASTGFTNPMSTLGDIIYENATPAAARLAGSTSATKNFLTQTGTGSASAAPAWGTIAASDLAATANEQGFAELLLAPGGAMQWGAPWRFYADAYGAKGDGKVLGDVVTNGTTTITSATANFTSGDVGKYIMIHGANGATGAPLLTTIASFTNSTTVVLTAAAGASVSNCPAVYGTDDVAAINSALTAAGSYATTFSSTSPGSGNFFAEVAFSSKIYVLGTGPTQTSSPTLQNSQLVLPFPNANGTTRKLVIALTGPGDAGYCQYWESLIPNVTGAALVSMTTAPSTPSGTFGNQSVIGGPSGSSGLTGGFANVKAVVRGLSVWCGLYTNQYAYDFGYITAMRVQQSSAHIFAPTGVNASAVAPYLKSITATALTSSIGSGFRTPVMGNNADSYMDDVTAEGYECNFRVFDHFTAGRIAAIYSDVAMKWDASQGAAGTGHGIFIQSMCAEQYNGGLLTNGGSCQVDINWDTENSGAPNYDVNDGTGLFGIFRFADKVDNRAPIVTNGAANLKIINDNQATGHMGSPPSVPGSTSTATLVYRDAWVSIHTGAGVTVSAVTIDGTATGLTMVASSSLAVQVPSGKTIALTYAGGTPTWDWWLS